MSVRDAGGVTLCFTGNTATGDHTSTVTVRGWGSGRQAHWQGSEEAPPAWQQHFIPAICIPAICIPAICIPAICIPAICIPA